MKKQLQGFALGTAVLGSLLETANGAKLCLAHCWKLRMAPVSLRTARQLST